MFLNDLFLSKMPPVKSKIRPVFNSVFEKSSFAFSKAAEKFCPDKGKTLGFNTAISSFKTSLSSESGKAVYPFSSNKTRPIFSSGNKFTACDSLIFNWVNVF